MRSLLPSILLAAAIAAPLPAHANGQTTHVWITLEALEALPDGEVRALLTRPELRDPLVNGTMFPDGGYAVGDGYGELAHWEPLQQAYLGWIRETFEPPYDQGEAAAHVAFLMGMASHGMADEVFDSAFMELSRQYDPWGPDDPSFDTATDVLHAADSGGIQPPEEWAPYDVLADLFVDELGYEVTAQTLAEGQSLLFVALAFTDWARTNEERIATFGDAYPWARDRLLDPDIPGSPPNEALAVARYWQETWDRLNGAPWSDPVVDFRSGTGRWGHETDAARVESRLFVTFGRGVDASGFADAFTVTSLSDGAVPEFSVSHHYGDLSHAVVLYPAEAWDDLADYVLTVDSGLLSYDGDASTGAFSAEFSTRPEPEPEAPEPSPDADGCACAATIAPGAGGLLGLVLLPLVRRRRA